MHSLENTLPVSGYFYLISYFVQNSYCFYLFQKHLRKSRGLFLQVNYGQKLKTPRDAQIELVFINVDRHR